MSQDVISDALNQIMNAKKTGKKEIVVTKYSKLLVNLLDLVKKKGYVDEFKLEDKKLVVKFSEKLNACKAIKPRYNVKVNQVDSKVRRFLPSRGFGILVLSTNKGLLTHVEAEEQKIGGELLAYFY